MPPPVTSASNADIIAAFGGLTGAIAQEVKDHPAFGTALMQELRAKLGPAELKALVATLGAEERPFKPAVPWGDLRQVLREAPESLGSKFVFENEHRIRTGYTQFEINPPRVDGPMLESTAIEPNENGGVTVKAGRGFDAFTGAAWNHEHKLSDFVTPTEAQQLRDAGFNVDQQTSVLVLKNSTENDPVILAFNPGAHPWDKAQVACICTKVTVVTMDGRSDFVLEKPVVYFYPEQKTHLTVKVELDGEMIAEYPKSESGVWSFIATPDGTLFEPKSERKFSYLFWEGRASSSFELDPSRAFCVKGDETAAFLETVSNRFGFNDRERTDFISYWIARLERNRYNVVQFLGDAEYDAYAKMTVEPKPETVIRLFMIYAGAPEPIACGEPELPARIRKGYTVVEWGGCEIR